MPDEPETTEKPINTRRQRGAAAEHSKRYRQARKSSGVPNGRKIDTAIAAFILRRIIKGGGFTIRPEQLPELERRVIRRAGWDQESDEVKAAVAARAVKLAGNA